MTDFNCSSVAARPVVAKSALFKVVLVRPVISPILLPLSVLPSIVTLPTCTLSSKLTLYFTGSPSWATFSTFTPLLLSPSTVTLLAAIWSLISPNLTSRLSTLLFRLVIEVLLLMSRVSPSLALGAIVILAPSAAVSTLTSILSLAPINLISVLFSPPSLISVLVPISLLTVNPPCSFVIFSLLVVWSVLSSSTRFFTLLSCATLTASVSSVPAAKLVIWRVLAAWNLPFSSVYAAEPTLIAPSLLRHAERALFFSSKAFKKSLFWLNHAFFCLVASNIRVDRSAFLAKAVS